MALPSKFNKTCRILHGSPESSLGTSEAISFDNANAFVDPLWQAAAWFDHSPGEAWRKAKILEMEASIPWEVRSQRICGFG